jgi:RsiW-degrading membrane proteinase PrsW (M82 family)
MRRVVAHLEASLFPLFVAGFAVYYVISTRSLPWRVQTYGFTVALLAFVMAVALVLMGSFGKRNAEAPPFGWVLATIIAGIIFAIALPILGYVFSVILLTAVECGLWARFGLGGKPSPAPWKDTIKGFALGCVFALFAFGMVMTSQATLRAFPWS